jgi:hypothetical protein
MREHDACFALDYDVPMLVARDVGLTRALDRDLTSDYERALDVALPSVLDRWLWSECDASCALP